MKQVCKMLISLFTVLGLIQCSNSTTPKSAVPEVLLKYKNNRQLLLAIELGTDCPISRQYVLQLDSIQKKDSQQVQWLGIVPGQGDTSAAIDTFKKETSANFTILNDPDFKITHWLNATVMPEAFILDSSMAIRYSGAIDNWYKSPGFHRPFPTENYTTDAIESLLNGIKPAITKTSAVGCVINLRE